MSVWYFLIEYGTMIILAVMAWFGASKVFIGSLVDNPTSFLEKLNNFLEKWRSLINTVAVITGVITIVPILTDYFGSKHYVCGVSALHVRAQPGTYSRSLTSIPEKTEVVIIGDVKYDNDNDPWIKVKGQGFTGWVSKTKVCTQ